MSNDSKSSRTFKDQMVSTPSAIARAIASYDWSSTSVGDLESWDPYFKAATDNLLRSPVPKFIILGSDYRFIYNDAYTAILGDKKDSLGKPYPLVWPDIWAEIQPLFEDVYRGSSFHFDNRPFRLNKDSEEIRYFTFTFHPLSDSGGEISGLVCSVFETTQAVTAARDLQAAEQEQRELLESIDSAFFAVDANWKITSINNLMIEKAQLSSAQLLGKNFLDVFLSGDNAKETKYWKYYHEVMLERVPREFEDYYEPLDLWTRVNAYPKSNGGMTVFFRDINNEKKREIELRRAKEEAETANELKSSFLANMSHEIRTPLGAMMGFANLLAEPGITPVERASYISILTKNGQQLGNVINDILDLSKVETDHVSFEFMIVRPLQIAHEIVSLMSVLAKEKGLPLSFEDDGTTPDTVVTDPTRMRQVLMNLVGNALKFTKVGNIKITLSGYDGASGEKCCAFQIEDTGTGINPESIDRLFKVFSQADNSMTRKYGGTGLGLALSRALARKMGGDVKLLATERDRGSTFRFSIESREEFRAKAEESQRRQLEENPSEIAADALRSIRILLVEDSPDNQQLIWRYLSKYGAQIEIADNGLEGVRMAMTSDHDLVLMDIQMPVMDGYTAVAKLREKGYAKPIIALTAHAMADVRKKCQDVGCTSHLPKPINSDQLVRTITSLVKANATATL